MTLSPSPNRTASKKPRKPEPARVVETYYYEVKARGQWGAFTRTAAIYRLSDETIRRYVKQAEQPPAPSLDAELVYQPAPGERPVAPRVAPQLPQKQRRNRPKCHTICHSRTMQQSGLLCKPVRSNVAKVAQHQTPTFPTIERETVSENPDKLPQLAAPRRYPPRPAPARWDMAQLVELALYMIGPVPLIAWVIVGIAVLWLAQ